MKSSHALLAFGAAICLATTCSLSAYASPLKNYDAGKVAIDAGITLPSSLKGDNYKFSKSNSTYLGATVGIGQKTALNYKWNNYKADEAKTRAQQFNIMYKVLPGISAYAGYLNAAYDSPALFTVWGNVGYGNRNSGYEIGISKPILNNLEVNASYYNQTFDDACGEDLEMKAKGVNLGLTLKF